MASPESESAALAQNPAVALRPATVWMGRVGRALAPLWPYLVFTLVFTLFWLAGDLYLHVVGEIYIFRLEYPIALYLFFAAYQILRPSPGRLWLALGAVFLPYLGHDLYWYFLGDVPDFTALREIPELFVVSGSAGKAAMVAAGALGLYVLATQVRYTLRSLTVALPVLVAALLLAIAPAQVKGAIEWGAVWINPWAKADNATLNGRYAIAIYNESKRRIAYRTLSTYAADPRQRAYYDGLVAYLKDRVLDDRPVFLILLESFLDARNLKPLRGRDDLIDPRLLGLYGKAWGWSISPVFGGATPRAEIELLCGIPSLQELDGVELNVFGGRRVPCMPDVLSHLGYDTIASDPYIPNFYNAQRAYPGMGFREVYFAREMSKRPSYLHLEDGRQYLFDGELYRQNRDFLESRAGGRRLFNYLVTTYGHLPFEVQRPIRIRLDTKEKALERIVNQSYYRSGPLAEQVQWLTKRYPRSLVIAVADHLPVLSAGPDSYAAMGYMNNVEHAAYYNRILIVRDGKPTKYPTLHHFSVPDLVYDYLTDGAYCRDYECTTPSTFDKERLRDRYRFLLANAVLDPLPD